MSGASSKITYSTVKRLSGHYTVLISFSTFKWRELVMQDEVAFINPTPGQLSPHNLHSTPSSLNPVHFLVKENPLERNLRQWLERKLQSSMPMNNEVLP